MKKYASLLFVAPLVFAVGCGGGRPVAKLSGNVTFEGKKVTYGTVQVNSEDEKQQGKAEIKEDGTYEVTNSPVGKVKILVIARDPGGAGTDAELSKGGGKDIGGVKGSPDAAKMTDAGAGKAGAGKAAVDPAKLAERFKTIKDLPPQYQSLNTTPLTTTVEAGGSTYDIKLTKTAK